MDAHRSQSAQSGSSSRPRPQYTAMLHLGSSKLQSQGHQLVDLLHRQLAKPPTPSLGKMGHLQGHMPEFGDHALQDLQLGRQPPGSSSSFARRDTHRRASPSNSTVSFMTPTMSEVSKYISAVKNVHLRPVSSTQLESPGWNPTQAPSGYRPQPVTFEQASCAADHSDETWRLGPVNSPFHPDMSSSNLSRRQAHLSQQQLNSGPGPMSALPRVPEMTDAEDWNKLEGVTMGHNPGFVKLIEPDPAFPYLRPALPRPIKRLPGMDMYLDAQIHHLQSLPKGSLKSCIRNLSTPSLAEWVLREKERARPATSSSMASSSNLLAHYPSLCADPTRASLSNGDLVPKNPRYAPPILDKHQTFVDEYNHALQTLKDMIFHKGKNALKLNFENLDIDRLGYLSRDSMLKALQQIHPSLSQQALERLLMDFSMDANGKKVDYKGLCDAIRNDQIQYKTLPGKPQRTRPDPDLPFGDPGSSLQLPYAVLADSQRNLVSHEYSYRTRMKHVYDAFASKDDGTGRISRKDFMDVMHAISDKDPSMRMTGVEIRKMYRNYDRERVGKISYDDFLLANGDAGGGLPDVPEFMKPKAARGSHNGPIWKWDTTDRIQSWE